jgi:hypothetical protein
VHEIGPHFIQRNTVVIVFLIFSFNPSVRGTHIYKEAWLTSGFLHTFSIRFGSGIMGKNSKLEVLRVKKQKFLIRKFILAYFMH